MTEAPFFSIGVTTYNRHELLKQTLLSITRQTFSDFEVIVGNDYTQAILSAELLDIDDQRIRFVNHRQNLGEAGNMNSLLRMARGRYFTWIADDDLYVSDFLRAVHATLVKFDFPLCAFTSYEIMYGANTPDEVKHFSGTGQLLSGRQFLRMYLSGKLKAMGHNGVYDTEHLRRIGGIQPLCDGPIALYTEYSLLVRSGLLEKIAYVDTPLVYYRAHGQSWGITNTESDKYSQAGENLIRESIEVFRAPELREEFYQNLSNFLTLPLYVYVDKIERRLGYLDVRKVVAYVFSVKRQFNSLRGSALYWVALASLGQVGMQWVWRRAKPKFNSAAPSGLVKLVRVVRSFFPRHEHRYFWW